MVAKIVLDEITSSGANIEIPTGKTLKIADAGALKINNIAITTGAQGVISKTGTYPIVAGDFTGKSSLIVFVDVSAGTSTETIITLPAEVDFSTCAIHVVSTATHGLGNFITIKNDTPVEVYSLYAKGDHCELVSDGTTAFRTGNEYCTMRGEVALTASFHMAASVRTDTFAGSTSSNYTVITDIGSGWSTTNDDYTAPVAGIYRFGGHVSPSTSAYISGWQIYNTTTTTEYNYVAVAVNMAYGSMNMNEFPIQLAKDDVLNFWCTNHSSAGYVTGAASASGQRSKLAWWLERRI
jgi:hypothetical protein